MHKKWDNNVAILSGDAMLVKAYELLLSTPKQYLPQLLKSFNTTALEVCEGQQLDMDFEERNLRDNPVSEAEYMEMIRLKTSVLFGFSMQLGAMLGYDNIMTSKKLYKIGIELGLAFQLQDDLLDLYGGENFGKQVGGDILNAKKTYLLVKALEKANEEDRELIISTIEDKSMADNLKIATIKDIYDRYKIMELTQDQIEAYLKKFKKTVRQVSPARVDNLISLIDSLTNRKI